VARWIENIRPRSGPLAEAATTFSAGLGLESDPPRGVEGLKLLSRAIDAHVTLDDVDDDGERIFVELAGSYLGALLLDELRSARHRSDTGRHRLALGEHGYFDPFAALERVLDAEDVRTALAREVELAESEARGEGPIARVTREVVAQLERELGAVEALDHFETRLRLRVAGESLELDIGGLVRATAGEPDHVIEGAVRRLLSAIPAFAEVATHDFGDVEDRILPRLMGPSFVRELGDRGLFTAPLVGEIYLGFILRFAGRARFVRRAEVQVWGLPVSELLGAALRNLAARSDDARLLHVQAAEGTLVVARSGDGLDSARLLLPGLPDVLGRDLGTPFAAAVPHRDALFACPLQHVAMMRERAEAEAARAPHAISRQIFVVEPGGRLLPFDG
jgi:hypothetical protein